MGRLVDVDDLVDCTSAGSRLGCDGKTIAGWAARWDDFPAPAVTSGRQRLWVFADIETWATATADRRHAGRKKGGSGLTHTELEERRARARQLRDEGMSFAELAEELGVDFSTAWRWATGWKQKPRQMPSE